MLESLLISLAIVLIVCGLLWYLVRYLPAPAQQAGRIIVVVGAVLWLLLNIRRIIEAIAHI